MSENQEILKVTGAIVCSYVSNNTLKPDQLPNFIGDVYSAIALIEKGEAPQGKPAVSINKSITPDYVICLEDGKKLKMLKRYIRTHYNLTPDEYRRKWGLPADYPMVAPNYAKRRSQFAKDIGLGTAATKTHKPARRKKKGN